MTKGQFQAGCFIYAIGSGVIVMLGPQRAGTTLDFLWFMSICGAIGLGSILSLFKSNPSTITSGAPLVHSTPHSGGGFYGGGVAYDDDWNDRGGGWDYDPPDYDYDPPGDFAELSFREMNGDD